MNCKIILDIPKLKIYREFESNEELDGWLYTHRGIPLDAISSGITFALQGNAEQQHTVGMIESIEGKRQEIENAKEKTGKTQQRGRFLKDDDEITPVTVGPTTAFQYMGREDKQGGYTLPIQQYPQSSPEGQIIGNIRKSIGVDFENAFKAIVNHPTDTSAQLAEYRHKAKVIKNPDKVTQMFGIAQAIYNYLYKLHSEQGKEPPIFKTAVKIAPKEVTKSFLDAIHITMGEKQGSGGKIPAVDLSQSTRVKEGDYVKAATGKDVNYFVGEIDLIVIDSNGIAHVYDFKTSGSDYNLDGHPKDGAQVSSYKQILNQWEVSVDPTGRLITVKVNYNGEIDPKLPEQAVDGFYWSDGKIVDVTESYEFSRNAEKWFPSKKQIKYQEYDPTNDVVEKCWPGASATAKERSLKMDVEEELKSGNVRHIAENDSSYRDGNRLRYYKRGFLLLNEKQYIDAKDADSLRQAVAEWITSHNEKTANINSIFVKRLKTIINTRNQDLLSPLARDFNQTDTSYIIKAFSRYVTQGWQLVSDDLMIANGYLLFQKDELLEMVVLSSHNIYNRFHFDHGKTTREYNSIMGQFASDEDGMDGRWVLPNFYGNIEMMKGMIFLAQHPELFKTSRINKISTLSLLSRGYMEESNEKLTENYKLLSVLYEEQEHKKLPLLSIGSEFVDDVQAYVNAARDILLTKQDFRKILSNPAFADTKDATALSLQQIIRMIEAIRNRPGNKKYKISQADFSQADWKAMQFLWRALLSKMGYTISSDIRTDAYFEGDLALTGHMARSAANVKSSVLRVLHEATYSWVRVCQTEFIEYTNRWKQAVQAFYISLNHNKFWGGEHDLYRRFFVESDDGKLDASFRLKDRNSMPTKEENDILDLFYDLLDRFKYGNKEDIIEIAKRTGTYGQVPLVIANFNELASKVGLARAKIEDFKKDWNVYRDFLLGVDMSEQRYRELENIDAYVLPSMLFDDDGRDEKLTPKKQGDDPTNKYTTDLDYLFNAIAAEGIKREHSPLMLMTASAIRGLVRYMQDNGNDFGSRFEEDINKYVKRKIFGRPIISEGEENIQRVLNIIKGITSVITLGASMKAFVRETTTGVYRAYERLGLRPDLQRIIKLSDYTEALAEIIENCYKNSDVLSWHMQLNAIFGTANFSYDQMPKNSTIQQWGLKNLDSSDLFFTATWPDFIHRNAIVIAYLKGIGAYEAYSLENGILKYDMKKDKRFKTLLKYKRIEDVPDSDVKQYERELNLYKDAFESWANNGYIDANGKPLSFGDMLPQALSPRDVLGLKDIADRMYGNYDDETKSLMRDQLLGSLFLQFRTYGINRLQEFLDGDHFNSDVHSEDITMLDENGTRQRVYIVENPNREAVLNGTEMAYIKKLEKDVSLDEIRLGKATVARRYTSTHTAGGQVQTLIDMGMTLFVFKNQEEFEQMWKNNPFYRANLALFFMDTFGMLLLAFIINQLYGEALNGDYDDIDWFTQWSYNVAIGITQDGPLWSVLSSVVGDGAPPMLGILQNYSNNIMSVLTGKQNFMYGLVNSIGATRELAYLFHSK